MAEVRWSGQTVEVASQDQTVEAQERECSVGVSSVVIVGGIPYSGAYEVTPSDTEQVLPTASRMCNQNITVGAIPSNYGLITWNGSVLMVS